MSTINYWNYPTEMFSGAGAINEIASLCLQHRYQRVFLVSDQGINKLGLVEQVIQLLAASDVQVTVFDQVESNPSTDTVAAGVAAFLSTTADVIIALGGGSVLDAAKAIALVAKDADGLLHYDWNTAFQRYPTLSSFPQLGLTPLIMIPTTAGTGSELSREAVITHAVDRVKHVVTHRELMATAVILDPALTTGLPAHLTAATGVDALTHHLEAFFSPLNHPMSSGIALEGIRLIAHYLPIAVANPHNLEAREQMLVASAMAAVAFQKGLGGVHALAHALGARYHQHHGLLNAILLPYVLKANQAAIATQIGQVNRVLGLDSDSPDALINWLVDFRQQLGIPASLSAIGLTDEEADLIGEIAVADTSSSDTNPVAWSAADYANIYRRAVKGELTCL